MTTIANTVGLLATVAFAYDMANASHIVFAAMAFFFLLDVILNVFLLNPRHTFKIPLICSAFAGFVMWVGAVYVDRAFGGQDVTLLDSVYLRALFVTIFGYAAIASLLLEFRRRAL